MTPALAMAPAPIVSDLGTCNSYRRHRRTSEIQRCNEPAVARVRAGCVHEHMHAGLVCEMHRERLHAGWTMCRRCSDGPDRHACPLFGQEVELP